MDEIAIDKGVPLPRPSRGGRQKKYPFDAMQVGDSLFMPADPQRVEIVRTIVFLCAKRYAKKHAPRWRFTSRKVEGGIRIWRIEDRPQIGEAAE